jgi:hypothetical protein
MLEQLERSAPKGFLSWGLFLLIGCGSKNKHFSIFLPDSSAVTAIVSQKFDMLNKALNHIPTIEASPIRMILAIASKRSAMDDFSTYVLMTKALNSMILSPRKRQTSQYE